MIVVLVLLVVLVVVVAFGVRHRRHMVRDDVRRVGDETAVDSHEAALRAQGRSAWTRISGGF